MWQFLETISSFFNPYDHLPFSDRHILILSMMQVALVKLALKNEGLIVPGYTHLQRAQPVLLQHLLLAYVEQVC